MVLIHSVDESYVTEEVRDLTCWWQWRKGQLITLSYLKWFSTHSWLRYFTPKFICQPHTGTTGKVRESQKSTGFILWGPIHPNVVETNWSSFRVTVRRPNIQLSETKMLLTCRVRCSKILLVSWSLEKPSPPGLESKRLTLSETVPPSLSSALWSTFSLRLDALGKDSFTACSLSDNDRNVNCESCWEKKKEKREVCKK